jgi:hypothetical protein
MRYFALQVCVVRKELDAFELKKKKLINIALRALGHRWRARLARFGLHRLHLRNKGGWRGAWAGGVSRLCQTTLAHPIQARTGSHEPIVCSGSKAPRWPLVALGHKLGHCTLCRWPVSFPMGWWVC